MISVRDHGAKGNGRSDDSPAFRPRSNSPRPRLFRGADTCGRFRLERQVSVRFNGGVDEGFAVVGDGQGVSVIRCANQDGALRLHSELCQRR